MTLNRKVRWYLELKTEDEAMVFRKVIKNYNGGLPMKKKLLGIFSSLVK